MSGEMLRVENVSRRFGGLLAVNQAAFFAEQDRITALIGPNGAGKTTLFAIITGFLEPTAGRVFFEGADITGLRRICLPGAASHAPSRSRSPSPGSRSPRISRSAHICITRAAPMRWRPPRRSHTRSA